VARLTYDGKAIPVLINGDGFAYRLTDGTPLLEPRTTSFPSRGKDEKIEEHSKKMDPLVVKSFTTLLPEITAQPASMPVAEGDRLYLRASKASCVCGLTLKLVAVDRLAWTLDWAVPGGDDCGGRDLMVSTDKIYAGSQIIDKATGKELPYHRVGKGSSFGVGYGNLLLAGEDRVFSGGDGQNLGVYDARTFRPLGNGYLNLNPGDKKGFDLPPERMQELKRAGILFAEHTRLNWGSFATFSGNRIFARTQWGVYCIGDPKIGWQ
jgi:hypothetical protein